MRQRFFTAAVRAGATVIPYGDGPFRKEATAARGRSMVIRLYGAGLEGVDAFPVDVEVDLVRQGLPGFTLVGLAEAAVREARERVFSALRACGFRLPPSRITVNLAPAGRRKSGTAFDLPLALGLLAASGQIPVEALQGRVFAGELSLVRQGLCRGPRPAGRAACAGSGGRRWAQPAHDRPARQRQDHAGPAALQDGYIFIHCFQYVAP